MKWAIIGASDIASTRVIPALKNLGHEAYGVMSSDSDRSARYAQANGIAHHSTNLDEVLSWPVEAVYISTTNEKHASQAVAAARSRKHILCEKPIAMNLIDARNMIDEAKSNGVVLAANHHIRTSGAHQKIRELIAEGELGDVYLARINHAVSLPERLQGWRLSAGNKGGGVVLDITVHNVDTLRAALGSNVVEVTALTSSNGLSKIGLEDTSNCLFRFESGVLANTVESFLVPYSQTTFEIHGSKGSIVATGVMTQDPTGEITLTNASGSHPIVVSDRENLYVKTLRQFESACDGVGTPFSSGEDGFASLQGALAVLQSAQEKRTIAISKVDK